MARKTAPKHDDPEEFQRFLDMARELEAKDDPKALEWGLEGLISSRKARGAEADPKVQERAVNKAAHPPTEN